MWIIESVLCINMYVCMFITDFFCWVQEVPQKVPKLTIVPPRPPEMKETRHHRSHKSHKPERHKKHRHKRKRKKVEDSEDSDNEYSDPEFLV
jgi:cohesin loading factor subunit SCC2